MKEYATEALKEAAERITSETTPVAARKHILSLINELK